MKVISAFLEDDQLVSALKAPDILANEQLVYTHIFPYLHIPDIQEDAGCYITMAVNMPKVSTVNYFFKQMLLTVCVICHQGIMKTDYGATRTDYIGGIIKGILSGRKDIGNIPLTLVSDEEGLITNVHHHRTMRFQTSDFNRVGSKCSTS